MEFRHSPEQREHAVTRSNSQTTQGIGEAIARLAQFLVTHVALFATRSQPANGDASAVAIADMAVAGLMCDVESAVVRKTGQIAGRFLPENTGVKHAASNIPPALVEDTAIP